MKSSIFLNKKLAYIKNRQLFYAGLKMQLLAYLKGFNPGHIARLLPLDPSRCITFYKGVAEVPIVRFIFFGSSPF
jgi:hypothetical protein